MLEYRLTFLFFVMGLIAFHLSALLFAWLEFSWPVALAMTVALATFMYGMWRYFKRIYKRFSLDREHMITGTR
jgi:membrane protein implicated in regulation of membrane protease activity